MKIDSKKDMFIMYFKFSYKYKILPRYFLFLFILACNNVVNIYVVFDILTSSGCFSY